MAKPFLILSLSLLFLFLFPLSSSNPNPSPHSNSSSKSPPLTAHAELTNYGFPVGLLPTNVLGYTINTTSGDFAVHLGDNCKVTLPPDNYLATYSKHITGKIVAGRIADINGIRVRAFFQWWSITGIKSSGDDLVFEVGMVSAKYPSNHFGESPDCEGKRASS
ncbi:hypothetical protein ACSBR1_039249 [Camellia fascicularis]